MYRLTRAIGATTTALVLFVSQGLLAVAHAQVPQPPEVAARSYLVLDVTANQILAAKDIDTPVEPASLTKLMSAYLVFDALKSKKIVLQRLAFGSGLTGPNANLYCRCIV